MLGQLTIKTRNTDLINSKSLITSIDFSLRNFGGSCDRGFLNLTQ
jgi:hypothetical protein